MSVAAHKETMGFQTEVQQLLHLMIHSLYSNKEIVLRELISNASDAADKLRFEAITNDSLYDGDTELKVSIDVDKDARTLTIKDNGIGMTRDEVIANIGTIAKSGTKAFFENLTGDQAKDSQLIGQFGVGFYSSYIIADKVTLTTRRAGHAADEAVQWTSEGKGDFTIETVEKDCRGTTITLHLREGEDDFLQTWKLRNIVQKFSDHIDLPIDMQKEGEYDEEGNITETDERETVNKANALWLRSKSEVSAEEYNEFYKHISHDFEDPMKYTHNRVEGKHEYTSLLFIPSRAPFDLWDRDQTHGIKLYVRRVFIKDDTEHLMPRYMRFVRGVIDSNDLPLNVSREILQQNKLIDTIKQASVKRVLSMIESMAKNEDESIYAQFWENYGKVMKEAPAEDHANKERVAKLLRFASTYNDDDKQNVSLEDYVSRMQDGQDKIYYITAESFAAAKNSPHLEVFKKKGIEVLLMFDRVDEWLVSSLTEFDGKNLQSVAKGELDLGELEDEEEKKAQEETTKNFEGLIAQVKETLEDKVKEVRVTHRLTNSPACLVADEHDMGGNLERILKAAGQDAPTTAPIFEINPDHPLVAKLKDEADEDRFKDLTHILFDQAALSEGGQLEDPASFVNRLNSLLLDLSNNQA